VDVEEIGALKVVRGELYKKRSISHYVHSLKPTFPTLPK
jgi:hypothetical protein